MPDQDLPLLDSEGQSDDTEPIDPTLIDALSKNTPPPREKTSARDNSAFVRRDTLMGITGEQPSIYGETAPPPPA
ncbi:MAG: hypothetical protein CUN53_15505, partial [Phototrophicales bacterium]